MKCILCVSMLNILIFIKSLTLKVRIITLISCILDVGVDGDRGLVAGRSQREKRRSYKDLLREEEEIAAQVRKSSKKRPKVNHLPTIT